MVRLVFRPYTQFDDRFARQNRYEPPPEFPLASPYSGIVHHLSGPNRYALTQIHLKKIKIGRWCHAVYGFPPMHSLSLRIWVFHPNTRIYVRLLGPCFKTGRLKPFLGNDLSIYKRNLSTQSKHTSLIAMQSTAEQCHPPRYHTASDSTVDT